MCTLLVADTYEYTINVVNTIVNHSQNHHFYGCYKSSFVYGWFIAFTIISFLLLFYHHLSSLYIKINNIIYIYIYKYIHINEYTISVFLLFWSRWTILPAPIQSMSIVGRWGPPSQRRRSGRTRSADVAVDADVATTGRSFWLIYTHIYIYLNK